MVKKTAARRRSKSPEDAGLARRRRELAYFRSAAEHQRKIERMVRAIEREQRRANAAISRLILAEATRAGLRIVAEGEVVEAELRVKELARDNDRLLAQLSAAYRELEQLRGAGDERRNGSSSRLTLDHAALEA